MLPWHPQVSAPSCLPRICICQPGHEAVCWLSDQSCLSGVQGQQVTVWLVSLEQQHGSLWKGIPFPFYEASTRVISSPAGMLLCSGVEETREGLIDFGLSVFWAMTLAYSCTPPPRLVTAAQGLARGLCSRQLQFMQEGDSGQRVHKADLVLTCLCSNVGASSITPKLHLFKKNNVSFFFF